MKGSPTMVHTGKSKDVEEAGKEKPTVDEGVELEKGETEVKTATRTSPRKSQRIVATRPMTRSLAGRPIKRRIREDNALDPLNQAESPSKKPKLTRKRSTRKEPSEDSTEKSAHRQLSNSPHSEDGRSNETPSNNAGASSSAPIESSTTPEPSSSKPTIAERIGTTRVMRATLPTPVPNLTKKSRGRRVPIRTGAEEISGDTPKDKRSYVCSVEGCGKCFHRGEHLKRHIRSIHTHEKPFKCTYPDCEKNFNRHDNLLQHIKVHKQTPSVKKKSTSIADDDEEEDESSDEASAVNNLLSLSGSANSLKASPTLLHPNSGGNVQSPLSSSATLAASTSDLLSPLRRAYTQMSSYSTLSGATSYESSADASTFASNMSMSSLRTNINVSSLRTEVPDNSCAAESPKLGIHASEPGSKFTHPPDMMFLERTSFQANPSVTAHPMALRPITTEQDWKS